MIKLSRYFEVPFDDRQIAAEELRIFAEAHIGSLKSHNASGDMAGTLTGMLTDTQAAFDPFDQALSDRAAEIGTQMGGTMTKNQALQLFRTTIRQRRGRVVDKVGESSAAYHEIFPGGLMYYTRATMQTIQSRLDYAVDKFTKFTADLGPELATEFTGLRTSFETARADQMDDKGEVGEARHGVRATRTALELQLFDNLLTLAKQFKGEPERAAEFFNQSLLEDPASPTPPPVTP
jgi:hypothetical protein